MPFALAEPEAKWNQDTYGMNKVGCDYRSGIGMRGGGLGLHPLTALQREFMDIALPGASEILLILRLYNSIESLHVCD